LASYCRASRKEDSKKAINIDLELEIPLEDRTIEEGMELSQEEEIKNPVLVSLNSWQIDEMLLESREKRINKNEMEDEIHGLRTQLHTIQKSVDESISTLESKLHKHMLTLRSKVASE